MVGQVLEEDDFDHRDILPRFCVGLDLTQGWKSAVVVQSLVGGHAIIQVDYNVVQVHCSHCSNHQHGDLTCPQARPSSPNPRILAQPCGPAPLPARDRSRERSPLLSCPVQIQPIRRYGGKEHPHQRRPYHNRQRHHRPYRCRQSNRRPPRRVAEPDADGFIPILPRRRIQREQGLSWVDWRAREHLRGYISPPYPSEFSNDVELRAAHSEYEERHQARQAREARNATRIPQTEAAPVRAPQAGLRPPIVHLLPPPSKRRRISRWDELPSTELVELPQNPPPQRRMGWDVLPPNQSAVRPGLGGTVTLGVNQSLVTSPDPGVPASGPTTSLHSGSHTSFAPLAGQPTYSKVYGPFDDPSNSGVEAMEIDRVVEFTC
jgi:hypothetical protein